MARISKIRGESRNRRFTRSVLRLKRKDLRANMKRLRAEMAEIGLDQKRIRNDQIELRGKFEQIRVQCAQLREETELIVKQKARNQILLCLAFKILKAREAGDFAAATGFARILREVIQRGRSI